MWGRFTLNWKQGCSCKSYPNRGDEPCAAPEVAAMWPAKRVLCTDIPTHYVWHSAPATWEPRARVAKNGGSSAAGSPSVRRMPNFLLCGSCCCIVLVLEISTT